MIRGTSKPSLILKRLPVIRMATGNFPALPRRQAASRRDSPAQARPAEPERRRHRSPLPLGLRVDLDSKGGAERKLGVTCGSRAAAAVGAVGQPREGRCGTLSLRGSATPPAGLRRKIKSRHPPPFSAPISQPAAASRASPRASGCHWWSCGAGQRPPPRPPRRLGTRGASPATWSGSFATLLRCGCEGTDSTS